MRWIYNKTVNMSGIYSALEEAFEFCWSSFADEHNTLPKSTRRNVKSKKFAFWTLWLQDLLRKHWFTSSVCRSWNNGWSMGNVYTDWGVDRSTLRSYWKWNKLKLFVMSRCVLHSLREHRVFSAQVSSFAQRVNFQVLWPHEALFWL